MECMQKAQKKERGAFLVCKSWSGKSAPRYAQFEGVRTGMQQTEREGEGLAGFQHPLKGAQAAPWNAKTKCVERIHTDMQYLVCNKEGERVQMSMQHPCLSNEVKSQSVLNDL
jgi:hypothetical protein